MRKEIPILYSTMMVQAILAGRKTMTRRIVKPQPEAVLNNGESIPVDEWVVRAKEQMKRGLKEIHTAGAGAGLMFPKCKFGNVGDILWVRESFMYMDVNCTWDDNEPSTATALFKASNDLRPAGLSVNDFPCTKVFNVPHEQAEDIESKIEREEQEGERWTPSIHMPKAAARIWQEVVEVRAERLNDIAENDAIAEGVAFDYSEGRQFMNYLSGECEFGDARDSFFSLWDLINGAESRKANPWVWVVRYNILSTTGKPENL